jgi:hypothetical protein
VYRVYYNRHSDYPYIWSIDAGTIDTEVKVVDVKFHKCVAETGFDRSVPIGDTERPRVFFTVRYADLVIGADDIACFFHNPNWRKPRTDAKSIR